VTHNPPSTGNAAPLIIAAESLRRNRTALTTSLASVNTTHTNRFHAALWATIKAEFGPEQCSGKYVGDFRCFVLRFKALWPFTGPF